MVYNNNQQSTSLMYYNDSNYFDQHFDGKNKLKKTKTNVPKRKTCL